MNILTCDFFFPSLECYSFVPLLAHSCIQETFMKLSLHFCHHSGPVRTVSAFNFILSSYVVSVDTSFYLDSLSLSFFFFCRNTAKSFIFYVFVICCSISSVLCLLVKQSLTGSLNSVVFCGLRNT